MNEMQEAARKLHAMGFKTLPIKPGTKEPACAHGVNDATDDDAATDAYYATRPNHGIGVSGEGFVIFDFDVKEHVDGRDALQGWNLPDTLAQTTPSGGYHLFYRTGEEVRPSVNPELAVDVRGWHSYVVCDPTPGYCFEDDCEIAEADDAVMAFLKHVRPSTPRDRGTQGLGRKKTLDVIPEGTRNEELFKRGRSMRSKGADYDTILAALHGINTMCCKPPYPDEGIEKIAKSVCSVDPGFSEEVKEQKKRGRPKSFDHAAIAEKLIEEHGACFVDGMPAIKHGNVYEIGWNAVSREIIALEKKATRANQKEVHHYLTVMAEQKQQSRPTLIAFENGVLDIETMELTPWDDVGDEIIISNVIPHCWNPEADYPAVDAVLLKMSCDESDVLESLMEVMGVCMYRSSEFTQSAILLGAGSNGKSTYIRMLQALLGKRNISSLDMAMVGKQFHTGQLAGKLANLGDDISNEFQRGDLLSMFKKVVDGNRIYTDVKGTEGFEFEPYATLVFSANEFPRLADYTDGMMRRIFPIEFNAVFKKTDADYDPRISQKVTSKAACERMCVLGVMGLQQVIQNNGFTPNAASNRRVEEIRADNDTTLAWANDNAWTADTLEGQPIPKLYEHYKEWCNESGLQFVKRTKFTRQMNKNFLLESVSGWNGGQSVKCFQKRSA